MKTLLEEGAICRDEALLWIDEGMDRPEATADLPPPARRKLGVAPNYERLYRVIKYTLSLHGVIDANGRQGVDEKKVREAFEAARTRENEANNNNAHKTAYTTTIKRLFADGVAERDGSIIRLLK